jgi:hypothetical protein
MLYTLVLLLFLGYQHYSGPDDGFALKELRRLLYESDNSKATGDRFYKKMQHYNGQEPVVLAYKGASEAIRAKYAGNPMAKLNHLKAAHRFFEQAVASDRTNPEIRFIRYSVESNTPKILNMRQNLQTDKKIIIDNILRYPKSDLDAETYKIARSFLLADDDVSPEEKKTILATPQ